MTSSVVNGFSFGVSRVLDNSIDIVLQIYMNFSVMIAYLVIVLYTFAPYYRILAFWLMLFVSHTTLN